MRVHAVGICFRRFFVIINGRVKVLLVTALISLKVVMIIKCVINCGNSPKQESSYKDSQEPFQDIANPEWHEWDVEYYLSSV